jgi:F-type H+-transporting ATPase subunit delta
VKSINPNHYSLALFSVAKQTGKIIDYQTALHQMAVLFQANPELLPFLSSFVIPKTRLYSVADQIWSNEDEVYFANFMKVLIDRHVIAHFADIIRGFDTLANEARGIKEGIVYSASPLDSHEISAIEAALSKRLACQVSLENRVDVGLIGGIKVAVDGKVFDDSLENKIEALRRKLLNVGGNVL